MATLGFVRNNPWVQRDKLAQDSYDHFDSFDARPRGASASAILDQSSRSMEEEDDVPEYGPGIVRLLRDKFLQMAESAAQEAQAGRWKHSKARKAVSCESLLDGPLNGSITQPTPPVTPQKNMKLFGSQSTLTQLSISAITSDADRPESPKAPELPLNSLKAVFESPHTKTYSSPKNTTPLKTDDLPEQEPEFMAAFKRLRPVPKEMTPAKREPPPSDPSPLSPPSHRLPELHSPASDESPPPEEPHPPFNTQLSPPMSPLPSPVISMPEDGDSDSSESGMTGSYDITPVPSTTSTVSVPSSISVQMKSSKSTEDEAYPHSPDSVEVKHSLRHQEDNLTTGHLFPEKKVQKLEETVEVVTELQSNGKAPPSPEQQEILKAFADNIVKGLSSNGSSKPSELDRDIVIRLLEEYRAVLPLVAEEDLPQLLAPETSFHYEFESGHGLVPGESNLQKDRKPAKGSVGFRDGPIRAYAYARHESEDEEEISWDWVKGVELDDRGYQDLCLEVRASRDSQWSDMNSWVENSDPSWSKPLMPTGGLVSYVPSQLQNADLSSDFDSSWNYAAGQSAVTKAEPSELTPAEVAGTFSQNEESTPDLLF